MCICNIHEVSQVLCLILYSHCYRTRSSSLPFVLRAAIARYIDWVTETRHVFSHTSGGWKFRIKVPGLVSSDLSLAGWHTVTFLFCMCGGRGNLYTSSFSYKDKSPIRLGSTLITLFNLSYLPFSFKALSLNTVILGVKASLYEFGELQFSP